MRTDCSIAGADRMMVRYRSSRPPDTELRARLRELANERRRFGYRRLFVLLRREGERSGINRIHRLYGRKGLPCASVAPAVKPVASGCRSWWKERPNARWSLDFVYDQFANGGAPVSTSTEFAIKNVTVDLSSKTFSTTDILNSSEL
jgi:putative transposase